MSEENQTTELLTENPRRAAISSLSGHQIGVCIYLAVVDLRSLDIEVEDASEIQYHIDPDSQMVAVQEVTE
jgi:hypothetical protein